MSLIGKKILNLLNNPSKSKKRHVSIKNFEDVQSIGILYTWSDKTKMDSIDEFSRSLGKEYDILCFNPMKEPIESIHSVLNISELSNLGKIKSTETASFLAKQFDYLFVLDFDLSEVTKHLILNSIAGYKIGCYGKDTKEYFDLMISINENAGIVNFANQVLKYVKAIRHE